MNMTTFVFTEVSVIAVRSGVLMKFKGQNGAISEITLDLEQIRMFCNHDLTVQTDDHRFNYYSSDEKNKVLAEELLVTRKAMMLTNKIAEGNVLDDTEWVALFKSLFTNMVVPKYGDVPLNPYLVV